MTVRASLPWAYLALVGLLVAASFFVPRDHVFMPGTAIADPGKATLDLFDGLIKLIASLNTALLAAAGAIAVKGKDWSARWGLTDAALIILVFVCSATSYYGIYLCYVRLLSMVGSGRINPLELQMTWAIRLAYWGVILGVSLLGLVFTRMLTNPTSPPSVNAS
jgi:hypothetical protein